MISSILLPVFGFIDTIVKGFLYGWSFIVPAMLILIFLIYKNKKTSNPSFKKIIKALLVFIGLALITSRVWGPSYYKNIIRFSICNKENLIKDKLEKKYNKNFTYVSQEGIEVAEDAGNILGQNINWDYSVMYRFKDDDGVIALVKYIKNSGYDYYEFKREKYDFSKQMHDYADAFGYNGEFYVFLQTPSALISSSSIDETLNENEILDKRKNYGILFIIPDNSDSSKFNGSFIYNASKKFFGDDNYVDVYEYIVTENEYKRAISYYESEQVKNGIEDKDYDSKFHFNDDEIISSQYHSLIN